MTRKDLYKRLKAYAKRNGKEREFDAAYPTFQDWESYNFSSHGAVEKTLGKLKDKNILTSDWTIEQFYKKFTCDLEWAKYTTYCGGTSQPPTSTDDYVGSYKTKTTPEENFEIVKQLLSQSSDFKLDSARGKFPDEIVDENGCIQTLPHKHKMDGAFAAKLVRVS